MIRMFLILRCADDDGGIHLVSNDSLGISEAGSYRILSDCCVLSHYLLPLI